MYDDSIKSWRKIASLPTPRSDVAIATIKNNVFNSHWRIYQKRQCVKV